MSKILVVAEQRSNKLKSQSFEVVTLAKSLGDVVALVIGSNVQEEAKSLAKFGVANIIVAEAASLENYASDLYSDIVKQVAEEQKCDVVLLAASAMGKDLSGHIGAKLNAGVAQDCTKVNTDLSCVRPMYAGKVMVTVALKTAVKVISVRANAVKAEEAAVSPIISLISHTNNSTVAVKELQTSTGKKLDVAEAKIIVTGGRGMGGPENWHLIEGLAEVLHAATGASRAVVDAGWRPHGEQVGQTGKTVSPSLYVACAVSGAIQHLAGMKTSKYILAINKDPEAPIFKVADFGIVGDVFEILPKLKDEISKVRT